MKKLPDHHYASSQVQYYRSENSTLLLHISSIIGSNTRASGAKNSYLQARSLTMNSQYTRQTFHSQTAYSSSANLPPPLSSIPAGKSRIRDTRSKMTFAHKETCSQQNFEPVPRRRLKARSNFRATVDLHTHTYA